jgi:hypothetical protein
MRLGKMWHKRRLMDRWRCIVEAHSYCFKKGDSIHVQLTEEDMDVWVDALACPLILKINDSCTDISQIA